ncbi:MAG: hypothetical protein RMY29_000530 [Nostoc sp. CreGUA01]
MGLWALKSQKTLIFFSFHFCLLAFELFVSLIPLCPMPHAPFPSPLFIIEGQFPHACFH